MIAALCAQTLINFSKVLHSKTFEKLIHSILKINKQTWIDMEKLAE
jgi:hypothetical protein